MNSAQRDTLDEVEAMRRLDSQDMLGRIRELPQQCREAWQLVSQYEAPTYLAGAQNLVVCGLGGSAIGADIVQAVASAEVPIIVWRDYGLPPWAGPQTLVICSSYSGHTEETLSAFAQALGRGCRLLAITTGGELSERARQQQVTLWQFHYPAPPRAALGYSVVLLLGVLSRLGYAADKGEEVEETAQVVEKVHRELEPTIPTEANPAKQLAQILHQRLPVVYGAGILGPVARRWKGQFNENSKAWAFFEQMPEINHNAVVGYQFPPSLAPHILVILLRSSLDAPRIQLRWEVTQDILSDRGIAHYKVEARGESPLAQAMSVVAFGDYASYYLALLNGVDPTPVEAIAFLKERLASQG